MRDGERTQTDHATTRNGKGDDGRDQRAKRSSGVPAEKHDPGSQRGEDEKIDGTVCVRQPVWWDTAESQARIQDGQHIEGHIRLDAQAESIVSNEETGNIN